MEKLGHRNGKLGSILFVHMLFVVCVNILLV